MATFVCAPAFILGTLLLTFVFSRRMNPHRRRAVRVWMFIEIAAGILQFLNPSLLIIGYATSIGMMILFMELENPESEMDRNVNVFSAHIMHEYVRTLYETNTKFSGILIINRSELNVSRQEEQSILIEMAQFLKSVHKKAKVFRGTGNDFAIIIPPKYYSDDLARDIYERFILNWQGHEIRTLIISVPDNTVAQSPDEVTQFYQYYRSSLDTNNEKLIYFDETEAEKLQSARIIQQEIIQALADDRLEVFYQPIYSLKKKNFVSAEALARLRRADGSLMMPGMFIPVAEKTGLVEPIGQRVMEKVCEMLREHPLTEIGVEYIEVNLSVAQCENRWLPDDIEAITSRYDIMPEHLNLEITETSTIRYRDTVIRNMEKLTSKGFSFSLDDFGTGESNLNYIVDMPVQIVKFDRTMTQDYFKNGKTKLVMRSIVDMVKNMDLKVVAEGIEEKEQLDAMAEIGVDYIQGYYFSKPLPLSEFLTFIHVNNIASLKKAARR